MPAPDGWFDCQVVRAGPQGNGEVMIWLADLKGSFNHWFKAHEAVKKEILATALAAVTTGFPANVHLQSTDQYSTVDGLYMERFPFSVAGEQAEKDKPPPPEPPEPPERPPRRRPPGGLEP